VNSATGSITNRVNTLGSNVTQGFEKVQNTTQEVTREIEGKLVKFGREIETKAKEVKTEIEKKTEEIRTEVERKFVEFGKEIETKTNDLVINKIKSFFDQLGNIFEMAIVVPFKTLFIGLGDVFLQIFEIIKMIGDKIISLPNCIFIYAIKTLLDTVNKIYTYIIPSFIRNFITAIYNSFFKWLVDYVLKWFGYTGAVERCYGFNVNDKVNNMNDIFKNISRTFNSSFGNVKNYKIKI
jgi:hypothetical protein